MALAVALREMLRAEISGTADGIIRYRSRPTPSRIIRNGGCSEGRVQEMKKFDLHSAAMLLPKMLPEEYESLKRDIEQNGQNEPIVLSGGKLVDGRHRAQACDELGIKPDFCELEDSCDPVAYVLSANVKRRHLTPSQKAMVAADMATLQLGANQHSSEGAQECAPSNGMAAELFGVSKRLVVQAKALKRHGAKSLCDAVKDGLVTVTAAAGLIRLEPSQEDQARFVAQGPKAIHDHVNSYYSRNNNGQSVEVNAGGTSSKASDSQQIVDEVDENLVAECDNAEADNTREMEVGESQAVEAIPSAAKSKDDRVKLAKAKLAKGIGVVKRSIDEIHDASPNEESRDLMLKFCESIDQGAKQW